MQHGLSEVDLSLFQSHQRQTAQVVVRGGVVWSQPVCVCVYVCLCTYIIMSVYMFRHTGGFIASAFSFILSLKVSRRTRRTVRCEIWAQPAELPQ